ncbi:MAG: 3-oxoacyl-[acyl-carrier-protein] synthase III C-terminal domain-containing protein [Pseudomonadota bacterium]|nr:3-oxoacyl-[acyl-carrier-protein] synthase III C-terminal domain-containing protein [Pseudomonadota bacterium]
MYLSNLKVIDPPFSIKQNEALRWIAKAHALSDPHRDFLRLVERYGCSAEQINQRFHFNSELFSEPTLEGLTANLKPNLQERMAFYTKIVNELFEQNYRETNNPPDGIFHVTCTGYQSPSAAQRLVSKRAWPSQVVHLYHMGCYAALPAVRLANSILNFEGFKRIDLMHTELCTLHFQSQNHDPEQLVVQSLFGDGAISYSLELLPPRIGFKLLWSGERVIPNSLDSMTWGLGPNGFTMSLKREVPKLIKENIKAFVNGIPLKKSKILWAVHPGGPKIIETIAHELDLNLEQVGASIDVLKERGNMSSATLPHIWEKILKIAMPGDQVVSLAFGPGLTIYGSLMEVL